MLNKSLLINILKYTKGKNILLIEDFKKQENLSDLDQLIKKGFVSCQNGVIYISNFQKIMMAVELVKLASSIDSVCSYLSWQEFEQIVKYALIQNNYETFLHLRLNLGRRKSEIDIVGVRGKMVLCIDCKHWSYGGKMATLKKAVTLQISRTDILARNSQFIQDKLNRKLPDGILIPVIVTLREKSMQIIDGVPIVPIMKFHNFLNEYFGHIKKFHISKIPA